MTEHDEEATTAKGVDGSPLHTAAASSVFEWRGAGNAAAAAPESPAAFQQPQPEEEEETMPTKAGGPQVAICSLLAQGDLGRAAIGEKLSDLSAAQISSALNNSKAQGRIAWIQKDEVFRITAAGKEWLAAAGGEKPAPARARRAAKKKTTHRRGRAAKETTVKVDTPPQAKENEEDPFRCGVLSDGAFFISRGEVAIELDASEYQEMQAYQARLGEAA